MKIKIIVPDTGIQITKHVIVHAGDIVDIPHYQAEHLIRLKQAVLAPLAPFPDLPLSAIGLAKEDDLGLLPPTTAEV